MPVYAPTATEIEQRIVLRLLGGQIPLTDLTDISTLRQLVRGMIVDEYASLWRGLVESQRDWFIGTAAGAALDRRLADYGLTRPGAVDAYGSVQVTVSQASSLAAGAVFRTDPDDGSAPKRYRVREATPLDWGTNIVEVIAEASGAAGNTAGGTVTRADVSILGLVSITNPAPIANGRDGATDDEFRLYWRNWLRSLTRGTRGALLAAVTGYTDPTTGRRVHSAALEEWGGVGMLESNGRAVALKLYLDEGSGAPSQGGATAGAQLVSAVQRLVDGDDASETAGLRAAGVPTVVEPARALFVDVTMQLDVDGSSSVSATERAVRDQVYIHFSNIPVSGVRATGEFQGQFSLARLFAALVRVPGVVRVVLLQPSTDLPVQPGYKLVPGAVALNTRVVT